ncbi:MAG: hypothetical protein HOV83_24030 [Catenulispora sp.]|nr:hypothetical protein [Catenulispora sp.]
MPPQPPQKRIVTEDSLAGRLGDESVLPAHLDAAAYARRADRVIAVDAEGWPYVTTLEAAGAETVPVGFDTDGRPYLQVTGAQPAT